MIRDVAAWEAWEREYSRRNPPDFQHNLKLLDAMYEQARSAGAFPLRNPLDGIEVKIRMAQALNVQPASRTDREMP